jgi:NADP-dependent 3-hydroxy acid dehydrogenase YdfG
MADFPYRCALIIGTGPGISASLRRRLRKIGLQVGVAARAVDKLKPLAEETGAAVSAVDTTQIHAINPSQPYRSSMRTTRLVLSVSEAMVSKLKFG